LPGLYHGNVCRPGAEIEEKTTVASRPKILQNNSKPAVEKNDWPEKFGDHKAAEFWQKRPKTGRKPAEKNILKKTCFPNRILSF
jgi:hypothetical protein